MSPEEWVYASTKPFREMGSIQALWKWRVIFCIVVALLCLATAISIFFENLLSTTRTGMQGVKRGETNTTLCIESFAKILNPDFANVLVIANDASGSFNMDAYKLLAPTGGYALPMGSYGECEKTKLFQPKDNQESDGEFTTHLCLGSFEEHHMQSTNGFSPPFGAICVPEECGPQELESEEFLNWISTTATHYSIGQQPGILDTVVRYLSNILTFTKQANEWRMALLVMLALCATAQDLITSPAFPFKKWSNSDLLGCHKGRMSMFMTAFSIKRNVIRLFSVREENELSSFEGMKVLSVMWVILGHWMALQAPCGYINPEAIYPPNGILSSIWGQFFFSARFAVDSFFFFSGFLVVYVILKRYSIFRETKYRKNEEEQRILLKGDGKTRVSSANFTQLYVLSPIVVEGKRGKILSVFFILGTWQMICSSILYLLYLFLSILNIGILALTLSLIASIVAMAWGTVKRNWSALSFDGEWSIAYDEETYTMPWFRIVPYLFGMGFAIYWHEQGQKVSAQQRKMSKIACLTYRSCAIGIFALVCFIGHSGYVISACQPNQTPDTESCGSGWSVLRRVLYNSLTRPAWCTALILFCIPCFHNQGGITQLLLNRGGWVPFARLTFLAYLLHPAILNVWMLNQKSMSSFTRLNFVMSYMGGCSLTFGSALLVNLLVESPITIFGKYVEHSLRQTGQGEQENGGNRDIEYEVALQSPSSGGGSCSLGSSGDFHGRERNKSMFFDDETARTAHAPYLSVETVQALKSEET